MKILISDAFDGSLPGRLESFGEVTDNKDEVGSANVVLVRSKTKCTPEYMDAAPNLKLIIRGGVGLDNVDLNYAKTKDITVHNTPAASSIAVAELAVGLMLAASGHIAKGHMGMTQGQWLKKELKRVELFKKTVGFLGAGRIATETAKRVQAFGTTLVGFDPHLKSHDIVSLKPFDEVLATSDFLSVHTPLTDSTRHLLDAAAIDQMKTGSIVVNTSRAECVDDVAMKAALDAGKVACYATDVWPTDPPPADNILVGHKSVLMTPHIGASSKENLLRIGDEIVRIISEFKS